MYASVTIAALAALPAAQALILPHNVGKLPALGWNSWNAFGCDVNETKILTAANQVVKLGLKAAGYEYINIDDCWSVKSGRDNATGQIIPNPVTFPTGIKGIADQVHALGLKLGIYSSAGTKTCGGYPASIGYEYLDAKTFSDWGVDYLKYDNCYVPSNWTDQYEACVPDQWNVYGPFPNGTCAVGSQTAPSNYDWSSSNTAERYRIMRDALLAQKRTILYSLCEWGQADVEVWGNSTGSSWRMSGDITPHWARVAEIMNENSFRLNSVNFWGHNDADMLEVGNGDLTIQESRSHFAFWAAMKSPLIIGTALNTLPADHVAILKTRHLLEFHQDDVYGGPATPYKWGVNPNWTFNYTNPAEYWSGQSKNGVLVLALNSLNTTATRTINFSEVPQLDKSAAGFEVTEVWTGKRLGCVANSISETVASHDTIAYMVKKPCTPRQRRQFLA